jgi:predicted RNase H-like HicB family nuclease
MGQVDLEKRAKELASQPYSVVISLEDTVAGDRAILASHPELPGCMSDGVTLDEALENLADARYEYILSLLEDNLPVPIPSQLGSTTATTGRRGYVSQVVVDISATEATRWVYEPTTTDDDRSSANRSVFASRTLAAS